MNEYLLDSIDESSVVEYVGLMDSISLWAFPDSFLFESPAYDFMYWD